MHTILLKLLAGTRNSPGATAAGSTLVRSPAGRELYNRGIFLQHVIRTSLVELLLELSLTTNDQSCMYTDNVCNVSDCTLPKGNSSLLPTAAALPFKQIYINNKLYILNHFCPRHTAQLVPGVCAHDRRVL